MRCVGWHDDEGPSAQNAIVSAMNFDKCRSLSGVEKAQCQLNKAMVNVGAMFAKEVQGRVCTDVDARLANDTGTMMMLCRNFR